ncbi:hypothetical protein [Xylella fastidiosa]|uniref:hypothetical protein n=1 Tax=Xylella fastidiosa TaxID=2371 RepID=UPI0012D89219|nr:hypothetical protein [Xylella fastidiosa]
MGRDNLIFYSRFLARVICSSISIIFDFLVSFLFSLFVFVLYFSSFRWVLIPMVCAVFVFSILDEIRYQRFLLGRFPNVSSDLSS